MSRNGQRSVLKIAGIARPELSTEASVLALFAVTLGIPAIVYSPTSYELSNRLVD